MQRSLTPDRRAP